MGFSLVHISTADREGGSARSARRIHESLRAKGHKSRVLVGFRTGHDIDVDLVHGSRTQKIADRLTNELSNRIGLQYLWYPSGRRVLRHAWVREADVIQLYNTHGGYLSHLLLPKLARHAPIVWRLSDMWAMTGHCAYSGACERWRVGCGRCPDLETYPSIARDTTRLLWRIKKSVLGRARPAIVAPSRWLEALARESPMFEGLSVHRIPNGIDRTVFHPVQKAAARKVLNLPVDRPVVLYCAQIVNDNPRKGSADLIETCSRLVGKADFDVVIVGQGGDLLQQRLPQRTHALGYLFDDRLLAAAYSAADVMIAPSIVENLPNTILEAMACGTPTVAYDTGGMADAVIHRRTGWLTGAQPEALAEGVAALLNNEDERQRLAEAGLQLIDNEFSAEREAQAFIDLYEALLAERRTKSPLRVTSAAEN